MRKKLIEVALPLEAINAASAREKSIRHGHPSTLHLWWARRPLAAARAVIFAQMVDDPSAQPEAYPTAEAQEARRQELFALIEQLVKWENTTNEAVLERARAEIRRSWAWQHLGAEAAHLTDADILARMRDGGVPPLPAFHDPFAGGGALPLEAQRLGLEAYASDLNPVAVLINKAMIEIPPKFAGKPPVNPEARGQGRGTQRLLTAGDEWRGARGLAEDVRTYGQWMRDEAERRIGHLYPKIEITAEMAAERPDLEPYLGRQLTVIAWLWARTVKSPNPAFADIDVPLASTFMLSTKPGKEAYVEPVIERGGYRFVVKVGKPKDVEAAKNGTKSGGSGSSFLCLMSGAPMQFEYLRNEAKSGRMGARLMAIVAEGERGRVYLSPTAEMEAIALSATPQDVPETDLPKRALGFRIQEYGMAKWRDLFTPRQLVALTTFSDLVLEARERVRADAVAAGLPDDGVALDAGGTGAQAYADAVAVYLALGVDRLADRSSTICGWDSGFTKIRNTFGRQAIPMTWDYAEGNPFSDSTGNFAALLEWVEKFLIESPASPNASGVQQDASAQSISTDKVVSTDPPYCLAPGALVQTPEGYKPIEQIQVGDRVLTHAGRFARVTRTYQRAYAGALYRLRVAHTNHPLLITGDHPLLAVRTGDCAVGYAHYCHIHCAWMAQNNGQCRVRVADEYRLQWVPAAEMHPRDLVFLPTFLQDRPLDSFRLQDWLPAHEYLESKGALHYQKATPQSLARYEAENAAPRRYAAPAHTSLTPELCRLLGYFIAEGYANVEADGGAIHFVFHVEEEELAADVQQLMAFCFHLQPGRVTDNRRRHNQSVRLNFYSKPVAQLLRGWCYTADGLKRLPEWALAIEPTLQREIVRGYWAGDGYRANANYIASTNSPCLAGQLRLILQRLQIMARLHVRQVKPSQINGIPVIARGPQYALHVNGPSLLRLAEIVGQPKHDLLHQRRNGQHGAWWENGYLLPVRSVEQIEYDGLVYNLETEDRSYATDAGCVHNCDNIGYADLSDFFYVWLRRSLKTVFPDLFSTLAVPKAEELVSTPYRHASKLEAEAFFLNGMTQAMHRLAVQTFPDFPVTIYYAYKQAETENARTPGMTFTGWETFLDAVIQAGFIITGTWPMRTELSNRMVGAGANALASSIVLVCRRRPADAPTASRREFIAALQRELPVALQHLQRSNIAPVDLQQAAIGPGMAIYTRYARVLDAAGQPLSVRDALALINETLDVVLAEQEGDFDADTRWALAWFDQFGFLDGDFGVAETLSKAKNTSVAGMVTAGILVARGGKVRLLRPEELPTDWNPTTDPRLTVWEMVHHLVRALDQGELVAAALIADLGSRAETARELAYRLYTICERKKRAPEALAYNALVQSWPEIVRLSKDVRPQQEALL